jgi:hypothetical protein
VELQLRIFFQLQVKLQLRIFSFQPRFSSLASAVATVFSVASAVATDIFFSYKCGCNLNFSLVASVVATETFSSCKCRCNWDFLQLQVWLQLQISPVTSIFFSSYKWDSNHDFSSCKQMCSRTLLKVILSTLLLFILFHSYMHAVSCCLSCKWSDKWQPLHWLIYLLALASVVA